MEALLININMLFYIYKLRSGSFILI